MIIPDSPPHLPQAVYNLSRSTVHITNEHKAAILTDFDSVIARRNTMRQLKERSSTLTTTSPIALSTPPIQPQGNPYVNSLAGALRDLTTSQPLLTHRSRTEPKFDEKRILPIKRMKENILFLLKVCLIFLCSFIVLQMSKTYVLELITNYNECFTCVHCKESFNEGEKRLIQMKQEEEKGEVILQCIHTNTCLKAVQTLKKKQLL